MEWIKLVNEETLDSIKNDSAIKPVVLFKHSTRCSISATALSRLERAWSKEEMAEIKYYYLDLLNYRNISQKIESVLELGMNLRSSLLFLMAHAFIIVLI